MLLWPAPMQRIPSALMHDGVWAPLGPHHHIQGHRVGLDRHGLAARRLPGQGRTPTVRARAIGGDWRAGHLRAAPSHSTHSQGWSPQRPRRYYRQCRKCRNSRCPSSKSRGRRADRRAPCPHSRRSGWQSSRPAPPPRCTPAGGRQPISANLPLCPRAPRLLHAAFCCLSGHAQARWASQVRTVDS